MPKIRSRWSTTLFVALGVTTICAGLERTAARVSAQESSADTFEAASIRRNREAEGQPLAPGAVSFAAAQTLPGGLLRATGVTVRQLIADAYGFRMTASQRVRGGPSWLDSERYDVIARAATDLSPSGPRILPDDASRLLRALLRDRFKVAVRTETVRGPVYEMVLARNDQTLGKSLRPSTRACDNMYQPTPFPAKTQEQLEASPARPRCAFLMHNGQLSSLNLTMPELATLLGTFPVFNAPVIDKTGLTGAYDFDVVFQGAAMALNGTASPDAAQRPLLPRAIEEQLGLKLQRTDGAVDVLIVEHVERPTAN